ncbi:MAG: hypothetical protein QME64_06645, partial [bacterium]|nr:hypothetical protein [bacterium]
MFFHEIPILEVSHLLETEPNTVFLETSRCDKENYSSYLFFKPVDIIFCFRVNEIEPALLKLEQALTAGYYLAGFLCYEAGYAFEEVFRLNESRLAYPLLWFGVYQSPWVFNHRTSLWSGPEPKGVSQLGSEASISRTRGYQVTELRESIGLADYCDRVQRIKKFIALG